MPIARSYMRNKIPKKFLSWRENLPDDIVLRFFLPKNPIIHPTHKPKVKASWRPKDFADQEKIRSARYSDIPTRVLRTPARLFTHWSESYPHTREIGGP